MKVLDTTFLVDLLNGKLETQKVAKESDLLTTQANMYEVIRGMFLRYPEPAKFAEGLRYFDSIGVLPLTEQAIIRAAEISADLIKKGQQIEDVDCLTAGIAISNDVTTIVTRNTKHFKLIPGIKVESY